MTKSRMFEFITCTYNPLGVKCKHACWYCWARKLIERYKFKKYLSNEILLDVDVSTKKFPAGSFVFMCSMTDLFQDFIPDFIIRPVIDVARNNPDSKFLFLTKNPDRYLAFHFPENVILGITIETNRDQGYPAISHAPLPSNRLAVLRTLRVSPNHLFVSIEPVLDFDLEEFSSALSLALWGIAVGYDNYNNGLAEPSLEKTNRLVARLEAYGIKIYRKTIREKSMIV